MTETKVKRLVNPGQKSFTLATVESFNVTGFDSSNVQTAVTADIKSVEIKLEFNNQSLLRDSTFFATSYLDDIYYLKN